VIDYCLDTSCLSTIVSLIRVAATILRSGVVVEVEKYTDNSFILLTVSGKVRNDRGHKEEVSNQVYSLGLSRNVHGSFRFLR
jgi:hypothetical protein